MADLRITNLPAMAAGTAQNSDVLPVSDISASTTKKITIADLIKDGIDALPDGSINGDKVNFTLANGSVGTAQLADGSVTGVKLADGSAAGTGAALPAAGDYVGQLFFKTSAPKELYSWNGASWDAASGLLAIEGNTTGLVNTYVSTSNGTSTISADLNATTGPGEFLAGPSGALGAIGQRRIASQDLPTAGAQKGAVAVNGNGLAMSGDTLSLNKGAATSSSGQLVTYDDQGLVVSGAAIQSSDLPLGSDSQVGAVMPGSGLSVGVDGALNHANSVVSGTAPKITFDTEGHVTAGQALLPSDIPDLPASKITSGQFSTPYIADESITLPKLADYSIAYIQEAQPSTVDPGHIGVLWYQESTAQLRMWNGNSFRPIGFGRLSQENLRWGGTVDASTGLIAGVTEAGTTGGLKIGDAVPPASDQLGGLYLVVSVAGNSIGETPGITYDAGDWCLCVNATEGWIRIDTLNGGGGGGASSLGDLLDVTLTAEAAGEFIQLQANGQWQNIELEPGTIGALKPGDNVSELVNDAGYLVPGDDVSELNNDAGYITSGDIPAGANLWTEDTGKVYPTNLSNHVQIGGTAGDPNIELNATGATTLAGGDLTITNSGNLTAQRDGSTGYVKLNSTGWAKIRGAASGTVLGIENDNDSGASTFEVLGDGTTKIGGSASFSQPAQNAAGNGVYIGPDSEAGNISIYSEDESAGDGSRDKAFLLGYSGGSAKTLKFEVGHDGTVKIGGTLPSAPNIQLNSDGSTIFKNYLEIDRDITDNTLGFLVTRNDNYTPGNYALLNNGNGLFINTGDAQGNNSKIALNANGEVVADCSGTANAVPRFTANSTSAGGAFVIKNISNATNDRNLVQRNATDITAAFKTDGSLHIGGSLNTPSSAAPNITLNADGSATFAGRVTSNDAVIGTVFSNRFSSATNSDVVLAAGIGDVELETNGVTRVIVQDDVVKIGGGNAIADAPNISLKADGDAEFGTSIVATADTTGLNWYQSLGMLRIQQGSSQTGSCFSVFKGGTNLETIGFDSSGSASFAGTVVSHNDANGSTLFQGSWANSGYTSSLNIKGYSDNLNSNNSEHFKIEHDFSGFKNSYINFLRGTGQTDGYLAFGTQNADRAVLSSDGNLLIGGTLPSAPNIKLNADGSGEFSNNQTIQFRPTLADGTSAYALRLLDSTDAAVWQVNADGDSTQIGSATFAGSVTSGQRVGSSTTNDGVTMYPLGYINASRPGSADLWQGRQTGTAGNTSTISADGSASFAGDVQSTQYVSGPSGYRLSANNGFVAARNDSGSVEPIWIGLKGGTGSAYQTSKINNNGSATFAGGNAIISSFGNVSAFGFVSERDSGSAFLVKNTSNVWQYSVYADGTTQIGGTIDANDSSASAPNISLNANGSASLEGNATIKGFITVTNNPDNGKNIGSVIENGLVSSCSNSIVFSGWDAATQSNTSRINSDGSASFAGTITTQGGAGGPYVAINETVTFNLEPNDPNNYTTTEEEYEVEVPVLRPDGPVTADLVDGEPEQEMQTITRTREVTTYTGPTMDVKDTLVKITEALTQLKTAAASATTCEELRTAIDTALADV